MECEAFSRKRAKDCHPSVFYNDTAVEQSTSQKHFGTHLDEKLDFSAHIKEKISKANRGIGIRPTLSCSCPIHQPGEIKNSHEPPIGRNFFFAISLSEKIR